LIAPAHSLGATVEDAVSATRNHHVELAACHVVTYVVGHDNKMLAFHCAVECCLGVFASAIEDEVKTFAAVVFATRCCCESECQSIIDSDGELTSANAGITAVAHTACALVSNLVALGVASSCGTAMFGPSAMRLAAVPIAGGVARTALAVAYVFDDVARARVRAGRLCRGTAGFS